MISYTDSPNKFVCLSSDTKPTDFANGNIMREMDTSTTFMFDEQNKTWLAQAGSGGGGGGSYSLPIATEDCLGGVKATPSTAEQTEPIGIDSEGNLFTKPFVVNSIDGLQAILDDKQSQSHLLRIDTVDYHLSSNEYTDIFAISGSIIFDSPFNGKNIKTFYIGQNVELKPGTYTAMTKINVDYTEMTLPYTTDSKLYLVGYTREDVPLFTRSGYLPFPATSDNGKILKANNSNQYILADNISKTSELTNDSNFIDTTVNNLVNYYGKNETYTKTEINNLIGELNSISFSVVDSLPETGLDNIIYLIPASSSASNNIKDEYMWIENAWEKIGSTSADLSNYYNKTETDTKLAGKQNQSNLKRIEEGPGNFFVLNTDEFTDIFAINGGIQFAAGFTGKQIKTFYINEGVVLKADADAVVHDINIDFAQISIDGDGYTTVKKIFLVGYTRDDLPLFTTIPPTDTAQLTNGANFIKNEANAFSYANLSGKPTIPTVVNSTGDSTTNAISQNATTVGLNGKVGKTGDESIDGVKTFSSAIKVNEINSTINNQPLKLAAPVVELESRSNDGASVLAKVSLSGSNNTSSISHCLYPWSDNDTDLGTNTYKFKDLFLGGKINELTLPTGTKTIASTDDLATKQTKYNYIRFNDGTNNITASNDYTDIFVMGGTFSGDDTAFHGLRTLYLNKGVIFETGTNVSKINVDFVERSLPWTLPNKMHLVGYTQTNCPLFISDHEPMEIALTYTENGTGTLNTDQKNMYDSAINQDVNIIITGFNSGVTVLNCTHYEASGDSWNRSFVGFRIVDNNYNAISCSITTTGDYTFKNSTWTV